MKCTCGGDTAVRDTRNVPNGQWRKRVCGTCKLTFSTIERVLVEDMTITKPRKPKVKDPDAPRRPVGRPATHGKYVGQVKGPKKPKPPMTYAPPRPPKVAKPAAEQDDSAERKRAAWMRIQDLKEAKALDEL